MLLDRTVLPRVGVAYAFTTAGGQRAAVVAHRDGRRDLVVYHPRDPRQVLLSVALTGTEPRTVAELLGLPTVIDHLPDPAAVPPQARAAAANGSSDPARGTAGTQVVRIPVTAGSPWYGRRLDDIGAGTGATIVAVLRDDRTLAAPPPDLGLRHGDAVVATGTPEAIARLRKPLVRP
ncbi:cation:proton antiporter regulatory subunit [Actinomadura hibisca]|uniref:cation:proton antiporter regulatory subunit n=1 Tax=Actinomadura hibisca TaxID=68565 RepID=UPI00082BE478|nr:TrkA C-terminal domain-containing protein [Actinomadura hibisca]